MAQGIYIDPGVSAGWCIAYRDNPKQFEAGDVVVDKSGDWDDRCTACVELLLKSILPRTPETVETVVVEMPQFMQSVSGRTSASSGALVKLSVQTGRIIQQLKFYYPRAKFLYPTPSKWKGQRDKDQVAYLIRKKAPWAIGRLSSTLSHDWDAVGLMLWERGLL